MKILTEREMESTLVRMGYDIEDSEGCIDSTIVFDLAADLGYTADLQANETYLFKTA